MMNSPLKKRPYHPYPQHSQNNKQYSTPTNITRNDRNHDHHQTNQPTARLNQNLSHHTPPDKIAFLEREIMLQHERNTAFDHRITGLETTSLRIDNNVSAILAKLDSFHHNTPSKYRKTNNRAATSDEDVNK